MKQEKKFAMAVSLYVVHDTRFKKKSKKYLIKLRVVFDRRPRNYQTIYELPVEDWNKLNASRVSSSLQTIRDKIKIIEATAHDFISKQECFSFEDFEKEYILNNPLFRHRSSIRKVALPTEYLFDRTLYEHRFPIFKESDLETGRLLAIHLYYIDKLLQEHRIGTAVSYQTSYYSFFRFRGNVRLTEVTIAYLNQYKRWMFDQDYSKTTIGIYVRQLRTLFNEAIEQGLIKRKKHYPFGRRKYIPPTGRNIKKALTLQEVAKLYYYKPICEQEQWAKDFWFFSYLAQNILAYFITSLIVKEKNMALAKLPDDFSYLKEMYNDDYFPDELVDKVKMAIQNVVEFIEEGGHSNEELQDAFDKMTITINNLQEEFEESGSEIETVARESIGETVASILEYFKVDIDVEEAIRERDW